MIELAAFIQYAPLAALALVTVLGGVLCEWRHRRALRALRYTTAAQTDRVATLERDLAALLTCSRGMAERLAQTESQQRRLQTQLDKLNSNDDNQLAVQHAMKLLNSGVDLKNVTSLCELSEGEVEILQNLARHQRAA
jgi:hypothetical protein